MSNVTHIFSDKAAPRWIGRYEGITITIAAGIAGKDPQTVRRWCMEYGIGVQPHKNKNWRVSRPALLALLDGDHRAIQIIRNGDRTNPAVRDYY